MKSARFNCLLASTALGLVLVLGSHAGMAQQSDKEIAAAVPMPDTTLLPPLTAKDVANSPSAAPADTVKAEPKQDAAKPVSATADSAVADQLRDLIAGKLDRIVSRKADREGVESFYKARNYAPLWVGNGAADARAKAAIAYLGAGRQRRPRPERLSDSGFQVGGHRRNAGRGRAQAHRFRAHLCAPGADRPHPLQPRRRRHRIQSGRAGAGRGADQARRRQ